MLKEKLEEVDHLTIIKSFRKRYPGMLFEYKHVDKVKESDGSDSIQNRIMGLLKRGVVKQYDSSL